MKILYVATISNTINAFMVPHIKMLVNQGHQVDIACNIVNDISLELVEIGVQVYDLEFKRSPFKIDNIRAYKKLKNIIIEKKYDIVHTHTPIASVYSRLACKNLKGVKLIYTAHGFHFFDGAGIKDWMYYPVEKYLSKYTDILITINTEDYNRALKKFNAKSTELISGVGLKLDDFTEPKCDITSKRKELGIPNDAIILISVGEVNRRKNHEIIIRALSKLKNEKVYLIICGEGNLREQLVSLTQRLNLSNQVKFLGRREDISELCHISDIYVFPSRREGLGMAALEGMAAGLPIITSNVQGIKDYSENGKTGFSLSPTDIVGYVKAINFLIENPESRLVMGKYNKEVVKRYDITNTISQLEKIYTKVGGVERKRL